MSILCCTVFVTGIPKWASRERSVADRASGGGLERDSRCVRRRMRTRSLWQRPAARATRSSQWRRRPSVARWRGRAAARDRPRAGRCWARSRRCRPSDSRSCPSVGSNARGSACAPLRSIPAAVRVQSNIQLLLFTCSFIIIHLLLSFIY